MRPALIGLSIGAGVSLVLSQLMSKLLYGVKPRDPMTFGLAVLVLIAVALLASWIPARRAGRVDPMTVLHNE
jgi:ABC-type antimicrobial peptide transport system permease subunit